MMLICERLALCPGNNHRSSARTKTLHYTLNWPQSRRVRLQVQFSCLMLYGSGSNHLLRPVDSTNECLFSRALSHLIPTNPTQDAMLELSDSFQIAQLIASTLQASPAQSNQTITLHTHARPPLHSTHHRSL